SSSGVDQTAAASPPAPVATGAPPKTPVEAAGRRNKEGGVAAASAGSAGSLKRRPPQQPRVEDVASGESKGTAKSPALSPPAAGVSPRTMSSSTPPSADATTGGARKAMKEFGNAANSA
ncbi:unnamed protein product, partial [Ectocarpus sp. 8 AP-2014]